MAKVCRPALGDAHGGAIGSLGSIPGDGDVDPDALVAARADGEGCAADPVGGAGCGLEGDEGIGDPSQVVAIGQGPGRMTRRR